MRLPVTNRRKVGMTSNHHAPYGLGYTRTTMASTKRSDMVTWSKSHKGRLSSDWSLQLDSMKSESLVIADQHAAVNTFSGLVHTARQTMGVSNTRSRWHNLREWAVEGRTDDWDVYKRQDHCHVCRQLYCLIPIKLHLFACTLKSIASWGEWACVKSLF